MTASKTALFIGLMVIFSVTCDNLTKVKSRETRQNGNFYYNFVPWRVGLKQTNDQVEVEAVGKRFVIPRPYTFKR